MTEFVNKDDVRRVWTTITNADGGTLELDPGESAVLELPKDFVDPYLKPKPGLKKTKTKTVEPSGETVDDKEPKA